MKAKQSLFVPAMILLSWGLMRWQFNTNVAAADRATIEERAFQTSTVQVASVGSQLQTNDHRLSLATVTENNAPDMPVVSVVAFKPDSLRGKQKPVVIPSRKISNNEADANPNLNPSSEDTLSVAPSDTQHNLAPNQPTQKTAKLNVSYWALWRRGVRQADLANNGQIGASQAGIRFRAPITSFGNALKLNAAARFSKPLKRGEVPEGSIGASLIVGKKIPIELIAERRFQLGASSDSAWSLTAATGLSHFKLKDRTELDGYLQLGVVGARNHRHFIGGSAVISQPLSAMGRENVRVGIGFWGDAQRGATRLDIGPDLTVKTSLAGTPLRLSGQWRFRVAGEAKPSSGPAISIGGDF